MLNLHSPLDCSSAEAIIIFDYFVNGFVFSIDITCSLTSFSMLTPFPPPLHQRQHLKTYRSAHRYIVLKKCTSLMMEGPQ